MDLGKRGLENAAERGDDRLDPPSKRGTTSISLVVANDLAGVIIGPKGSVLENIRTQTGARVSVESTPTPERERLVQVAAQSDAVMKAGLDAVLSVLCTSSKAFTSLSILIEPASVGALIGKGGAVINQIRSSTGAAINILQDGVRILNTYGRCDITGDQVVIRQAAQFVAEKLYEHYSRDGAPQQMNARALLQATSQQHPHHQMASHEVSVADQHQMSHDTGMPFSGMYGFGGNMIAGLSPQHLAHSSMGGNSAQSFVVPQQPQIFIQAPYNAANMVSLEAIVPKIYLGHIIGKLGKYVNGVRMMFNVEIKVDDKGDTPYPPTGSPAAKLNISGQRDMVWQAASKCVENLLIGKDNNPDAEMKQVATLIIERSALPRLIGKGGTRINMIRNCSNCNVTIHQDDEDKTTAATCTVEGKPREVVGARLLLEAKEVPHTASNHSPRQFGGGFNSGIGQMNGGLGMMATPHMPQPQPEHQFRGESRIANTGMGQEFAGLALEFVLPKKFAGHVIGKQGKYINAVRAATGCDVRVEDQQDPSGVEMMALVTITGMPNGPGLWTAAGQLLSGLLNGKTSPEEGDDVRIETISVVSSQVGQVIGKGGSRINMIRQASNCKVQLEQAEDMGMAVITLEGGPRQILVARTLIGAQERKTGGNEIVNR